jgi:urease accessory protein
VRLIPLGQTDGQRQTAALETPLREVAAAVLAASLDDLGTASPMIDLCAIAHETQYTRLFRS